VTEDSTVCPDSLWLRFKMMTSIALPTILTGFIQRTQDLVNLSFLGHLHDNARIAGVGLGSVCANFTGWAIVIGMNSALDTLVSQSAGAGKLELCGVYLNRGRFIMTIFFLPVLVFAFYLEEGLVFLGQNPRVAAYTQQYMLAYLPGLYIMGLQNCQQKFLNNLKKAKVPMISQAIAAVLHVFWTYFLVSPDQLNLGIRGTGIAMVMANLTVLSSNLLYTACLPDIGEAVFWPDRRTFQDLGEYMKIGFASAMMLALDLLAGSALRFSTGYLSVDI
jgi:MATE family multidrug resistance protein